MTGPILPRVRRSLPVFVCRLTAQLARRGSRSWFTLSTSREERFFLLLAVFIGLFSGLAVVCFRLAIDWTRIWLLGPCP